MFDDIARVLAVLPGAAVVVGPDDQVVHETMQSQVLGLTAQGRLLDAELLRAVAQVRADRNLQEFEVSISRESRAETIDLNVRVAPFLENSVLLLVNDLSEAKRLENVRRDFVANVSHELKTPVGALSLLAEAVQSASDDPEAVRHFSGRMRAEAQRLSNLVGDLLDLSRLQSGAVVQVNCVSVDRVIGESVDAVQLLAQAKEIDIVVSGARGLEVLGDEAQLVLAMRNLLANAIAYSPSRTRVAVVAQVVNRIVEISVTDQGVGIPEADQARIFERFYRVDPARSRGTGGTGLGLALVKHAAVNHGGECTVWSRPGQGSTFTLHIPEKRTSA